MKKFGPYKGISNNYTNKVNNAPISHNKEENNSDEKISLKPSLDDVKRKYLTYIERHNRLSEGIISIDEETIEEKEDKDDN